MPLAGVLHNQVSHSLGTAFHPSPAEDLYWELHPTHLFLGITALSHRLPWLHSFWWLFLLFCIDFGRCCSMSTHLSMMWGFLVVYTHVWLMVTIFPSHSLCLKFIAFFIIWGILFQSAHVVSFDMIVLHFWRLFFFLKKWYSGTNELAFIFI